MTLQAGQILQHYRLVEKIGEGGMGVVWKAQDTRLHRHVALKFISEELAGATQSVDRHLREARAASAMNHPHICSIHDIGEWEGRRFIVMELLEGQSLPQILSGNPMAVEAAVDVAIQIADALAAAHAKGIIHRDIKPANIQVTGGQTATPRAKVLDFGLAKLSDGSAQNSEDDDVTQTQMDATTPGSVLGTVSYMSPEQALGKELDHRTDIFSLGVVLYEMVTAHRAFGGNTSAAVFDAILNRAPMAPMELNQNVPAELQNVINRAIEKDPDLRYQSAAGMCADLKRMQRDSSSDRSQAADSHPTDPPNRRSRRTVGSVITVLAVAIAAIFLWQATHQDKSPVSPDIDRGAPQGPSIAVLPFVNASGDPDQDYFSGGLTEDIITELSRYSELFVIARTSIIAYSGSTVDISKVGAELGVRYVLQGSVRKAGDRIRVTVQLSDAREGRSLWGNHYERDLTASDLFSLQDELTQQVVNAIAGSYGALSRSELAKARRKAPASLDTYDCVLRTYEYVHIHDESTHFEARHCLEQAVELDPDYAEGWAWLAYLYGEEYHHRRNELPDSYDSRDRALEAAENAVRLDPENQVSQGALGMTCLLLGDFERGRVASYRAIELNPNNALWLGLLGSWLAVRGDFEGGVPMAKKAILLNPNPPPWIHMPMYLESYHNHHYEDALAEAQIIETADYRSPLFLAAAYGQLGRLEEAQRALSEMQTQWSGPVDGIRQDMMERNGFTPEMVEHLMEGLRKAGFSPAD